MIIGSPVYKRVLLKISGEALSGGEGFGLDFEMIKTVCDVVKKCLDAGVEVGIVVGGGNFWRGLKDGNAGDIDKKNSITENTFKNFKSVNYGFGNSAAYNGGGDYLEFCFVVDGKDATLLDCYSYSIAITGLYGRQV